MLYPSVRCSLKSFKPERCARARTVRENRPLYSAAYLPTRECRPWRVYFTLAPSNSETAAIRRAHLTSAAVCPYHITIRNRMSKSKIEHLEAVADRDLYSGLIRLHVLHHAVQGPIFGLGMIEELAHHGYRISPGSLYPLLQGLEKKGYLRSTEQRNGKSLRRVYRATPLGRKALAASKNKVRELFHELIEGE
jgi:PadR family transcriptional regulator PadR